jgi:hypothetical protein
MLRADVVAGQTPVDDEVTTGFCAGDHAVIRPILLSPQQACRFCLNRDSHLDFFSYRLDNLNDAVSRVHLLTQAQEAEFPQLIDVSSDRSSIAP